MSYKIRTTDPLPSILDHCWQSRESSDLSLVCKDGTVLAHRFIVSCASSFVKRLLLCHSDHDTAAMVVPDVTVEQMLECLRSLYFKRDSEQVAKILFPQCNSDVKDYLDVTVVQDSRREYSCRACVFVGTTYPQLESHIRELHPVVNCSFCYKAFRAVEDLKSHTLKNHGDYCFYTCFFCNFQTVDLDVLQHHQRKEHQEESAIVCRCNQCGNRFVSLEELKNHVLDHHATSETAFEDFTENGNAETALPRSKSKTFQEDDTTGPDFTCEICQYPCQTRNAYSIHRRRKHGTQCPHCSQAFQNNNERDEHLYTVHEDISLFHCPACDFKTRYRLSMLDHRKAKHDLTGKLICSCKDCGEAFENLRQLQFHMIRTHEREDVLKTRRERQTIKYEDAKASFDETEEPVATEDTSDLPGEDEYQPPQEDTVFWCEICNLSYSSKKALYNHRRRKHFDENESDYEVKIEGSLKKEVSSHFVDQDDRKSAEVNSTFNEGQAEHVETQVGDFEDMPGHMCQICQFICTSKAALYTHKRRKHWTECHHCGNEYKTNADMEKHLFDDHAEFAVFNCPECSYKTRSRDSMFTHRRGIHNLFSTYLCDCSICKEKFETLRDFQTHLIKEHGRTDIFQFRRERQKNFRAAKQEKVYSEKEVIVKEEPQIEYRIDEPPEDDDLVCELCDVACEDLPNFNAHLKSVHQNVCFPCGSEFSSGFELRNHQPDEEDDFTMYNCAECGFNTQLRVTIVSHRRKVHNLESELICQCNVCEQMYTSYKELRKHLINDHDRDDVLRYCKNRWNRSSAYQAFQSAPAESKPVPNENGDFPCELCTVVLCSELSYRVHMKRKHSSQCCYCGGNFSSNQEMGSHLEEFHGDYALYNCQKCSFKTRTRNTMLMHQKSVHRNEKKWKLVTCKECGQEFDFLRALQYHLAKEHNYDIMTKFNNLWREKTGKVGKRKLGLRTGGAPAKAKKKMVEFRNKGLRKRTVDPGVCRFCGKHFSSRGNMTVHIKTIHADKFKTDEKEECICEICGKTFTHKLSFKRHLQINHKDKDKECNICGKRIMYTLVSHMNWCHDETLYTCEICGRTLRGKTQLAHHRRYYHDVYCRGVQPKRCCSKCKEEFATLKEFVVHKNNAHPEECPVCHKMFGQLKHHMKQVHAEKVPVMCKVCQTPLKNRKGYKKHLKQQHGID